MRLRAPQIEISPENPYDEDMLNRRPAVEAVTNILESTTEPLVLSLCAPWGYGKSTFLRLLEANLTSKGFKIVRFNAWESDFVEDPFVALLGDTELQLSSLKGNRRKHVQSKINRAKTFGGKIIRAALPAAIRVGSAGILNLDGLSEAAIADAAAKFANAQIEAYTKAKASITSFRTELSDIAKSLYDEGTQLPLVFIIDELDRCRPPHAVRVLEIVKHLFSIERTAFVIALDPEQLGHSVRTLYGQDMDVEGYLKRFFDLELNLPIPSAEEFLNAQFNRFGLEEFFSARAKYDDARFDKNHIQAMFQQLFGTLNFSFRERERCFALLSLAIRATPSNHHLHALMLGALIVLKIKNPRLYGKFVRGRAKAPDVLKYFAGEGIEEAGFKISNYGYALEAELILAHTPLQEHRDIQRNFEQQSHDEALSPDERRRAQVIAAVVKESLFRGSYATLKSVASKIDLVAGGS